MKDSIRFKNSAKRIFCVFLTALMLVGSLSGTAFANERSSAEDPDPDVTGISNDENNPEYSEEAAEETANAGSTEVSENDIVDMDVEDPDNDVLDIDGYEISSDDADSTRELEIQADSEELYIEDHSVSADGDEPELKELSLSWEGDEWYKGMEQSPYLIQSLADLMEVHEYYDDIFCEEYEDLGNMREHFKLTTDIALTEAWKPMVTPYDFCLDGNGHTISNLRIEADGSGFEMKSPRRDSSNKYHPESPDESFCGLTFCAAAGEIKNLTIKNATISCPEVQDASGIRYMQVFAYSCLTLDKCSIEGTVTIENDSDYNVTASGFCYDADAITDCKMKANVTISGTNSFSGFARQSSNFVNCGVEGNITGNCSGHICGIGGYYTLSTNQPDDGARNCYTAEGVTIHNTYQIDNNSKGDAYGLFSSMSCPLTNCVNNATVISDCGIAVGVSYTINAARNPRERVKITGLVNNGNIQGGGLSASGICYNLTDLAKEIDYSVINCVNNGNITQTQKSCSYGWASGLFYLCGSNSYIADCINYGNVSGSYASGIVSKFDGGMISRCANRGKIRTVAAAGDSYSYGVSAGIAGELDYSHNSSNKIRKIEDCYNAGDISYNGIESAGGILGFDAGSYYRTGSNVENTLVISNCYNVGKITSTKNDAVVGSIVGTNSGTPDNTEITGVHFLSGTASSAFGEGGNSAYNASKHSDADMKKASTYSGWDFDNIWTMGTEDYKYPIFVYGNGKQHTITLNANGGTIEGKESIEVETNNLGILRSAPRPINGDARFKGWYTEAAGGERVTQEYAFAEDSTIYAHWGTYDPEKRIMLENLTPANGASGICFVDQGNWTSLKISFTTNRKIVGFDSLMGGLRIIDSDSGEIVYELGTPNSLTKSDKKNTSEVILKFHNSGLEYEKSFDIEVDDGFLVFEDADCYALTDSENEWHFSTAVGIQEATFKVLNEFEEGNKCDSALNYRFVYSDSFFNDSAEAYNQMRTVWAFGLAMAGFESHDGGPGDGAKNAREMLDKFGFSKERFLENADYKKAPETETFGVCASSKEVSYNVSGENKSYTLIAVTTRGAGYGAEWYSNGKVGAGKRHQGFLDASDKILDHITDYIVYLQDNGIEISDEIKIVMAGYSRAAAATNLAAARINENDLKNKLAERGINRIIKKENVFAYCFEPPATVKNNTEPKSDFKSDYKNITNIINPADLVPRVPLSGKGWYYTRYGVTHYLANDETVLHYESLKKEFLRNLKDRLGFKYDSHDFIKCDLNFIPTFVGKKLVLIPVKTYRTIEKSVYLELLTEKLRKVITSAESYHDDYEQTVCNGMKAHFGGEGLDIGSLLSDISKRALALSVASGLVNGLEEDYFTFKKNGERNAGEYYYKFGNLLQEHEPFINFAWLTIEDAEDHFTNGEYSIHKFKCPVNLTVRDSEGKIVASIIDDVPQKIAGSSILSYIDDNGQKVFILPKDDNFSIEITGTDAGTMDYSVSSYSYEEGGLVDKTDYYNKAVALGTSYTASITEDGTKVLKQNNDVIYPDNIFDGDIPEHEISVSVICGDGSVLGEGAIPEGDHVKLTAVPDPGAEFEGWYETESSDEPLSTEQNYNFRVERARTVYAKFSEVADDVFAVDIPDQTYTGSAIKPEVMIFDQKTKLMAGKDYTISYKNNKNAYTIGEGEQGFNKKKAPQAIIKMKGNYTGKKTIYFKILPMGLSSGSFSASDLTVQYNGKKQTPSPVFTRNGKKLKLNTDYVVEEYQAAKNDKTAFKGAADEDTVYTLTLAGKKNYTGSKKITLTILGKTAEGEDGEVTQVMMNSVKVPSIPAQTYRKDEEGRADITVDNLLDKKGKPLPFTVTWQKSKKEKYTFTQNIDYTVTYRKNSEIGTASIILTGLGNKQNENGIAHVGTKTVTFKITGKNLKGAKISGLLAAYPYTGEEVIPTGYKVTLGGKELKAGDDYRVAFSKNVNAGTATMTVSGTGAYTGKVKKTFKIGKVSIGERGVKSDSITVNNGEEITAVYKKSGAKPVITLKWLNGEGEEDDMILTEEVDFKVKYQNTSNLSATAPASKLPTATITGTGSFTGSFKVPLTITPADFSSLKDNAYANDRAYSNKKGDYKTSAVIKDADGKLLKAGTDYEITEYALVGGIDPSTGNYVNLYPPTYLDVISKPEVGSRIRMTVKAKGNYVSENDSLNTIYLDYNILAGGKDISKAKVTLKGNKPFNGSVVKLSKDDFKSVKLGNEYLEFGTDFEIDENSYVNHDRKGTAKLTLIGKGAYGGRQTISFRIGTRAFKGSIWKRILGLFG